MTLPNAAPKPKRAPPKKRNELKKISAKKLAKLNGKMPFSSISSSTASRKTATKINRRKRKPSEFARIYGSRARVAWVKRRPCLVANSACWTPIDNAHTETGGTGRKADARTIVPLCRHHHGALHMCGVASFEQMYGVSLKAMAAHTHNHWLLYCGRENLNPETGKPQTLGTGSDRE